MDFILMIHSGLNVRKNCKILEWDTNFLKIPSSFLADYIQGNATLHLPRPRVYSSLDQTNILSSQQ